VAQAPPRVRHGAPHVPRLAALREHRWSAPERAALIAVLAIAMGSLFVTTYTLALGDPIPHRIDAALVGSAATHPGPVASVQRVADNGLAFRRYPSLAAARHAMDLQNVYAALDVASPRPTFYIASAAGASVARVLDTVAATDPGIRVVDTHPLPAHDPNGVDIFYLMLVSTIVGFITVIQVRGNAGGLALRNWIGFVGGLALAASLVFTLVDGPLLHRLDLPMAESWGILALHILTVASFASLASVLLGRWAMVPTWLFFVILGNSSSGGAVAPPLLPEPFALVSQWLPSGATVNALRNAVYFHHYQHVQPIAVLATWAAVTFGAMVIASRLLQTSPGGG
jgi:hypothetical protein